MTLTVKQQKPADGSWNDEAGRTIPYARIKQSERLNERELSGIAKQALNLNKALTAFKEHVFAKAEQMYDAFIAENGGKKPGKGKGGITLYNFDRSIKATVSVSEQIQFDDNYIDLAKAKLDELLQDGLSAAADFVKPLVMDAFTTSGGRLDTKRVLGLRRYADRIKDSRYAEAMAFIDKAIRKPNSKEYFQVWIKDDRGEYVDVQLNFSSIK
ncbi:DUF3164 family protein [Mucilaginibacter sp. L3T2-6]|uniref:DUF3164 family protein n=1 Tax=Mucilaginibacter sp. L3T2-6 TaxID=3062491 RepID=UPI00267601F7|nr:DUF3164 family protein [Mucilaginibacter sp. L3T2-6]MDO3641950.1 DUF3164 family protein [Mucilaginibacter sp. L3T2-6]MDV6214372.1 DUF3164 family protein [Mucilaginibacter sp. L3T2-6]